MIPDRAIQLLDRDGFIAAYFEGMRAGLKCIEAFNAVNDEYHMYFGKFKYVDYKTFAKVRDYDQKKIRKKVKKHLKKQSK